MQKMKYSVITLTFIVYLNFAFVLCLPFKALITFSATKPMFLYFFCNQKSHSENNSYSDGSICTYLALKSRTVQQILSFEF